MIPNFFILGAPKCGTSALFAYLAEHPRIFAPVLKEPAFWCSDMPELRDELGAQDLEGYLELFKDADPERHLAAGEASTIYLLSRDAAVNILEFNPEAKFVVMLRDPVEMVHALHMQRRNALREDQDFETAWRIQEDRAAGRRPVPESCPEPRLLQYRAAANYPEQLERLFRAVPRERVLVHFYDDFRADPAGVYARTLEHIGAPHDGRADFGRINAAHARRFPWLNRLVLDPPGPLRGPIFRLRKHLRDNHYPGMSQFKSLFRKPVSREPMNPELAREIRAEFEPDAARLADILGRPVPWAGKA